MGPRIPRKIAEFNSYVINSDNYLQTENPGPPPIENWQRLGLSEPAATGWHNARLEWDALYAIYNNPSTRTKAVTSSLATARETFIGFAQPLLDIMAASPNADDNDETALNFKIGRSTPSHPTTPIVQQCFVTLQGVGGAMVKFKCKTATDAKRASLPHEANSIMIAYKVGEVPPANADDGTVKEIITRASDVRSLGIENRGEQVFMYARWYNTHYPQFAGPWSLVTSVYLA